MKSSLRSQVRSWLVGRNGLVSNTIYKFHTFSAAAEAAVKAKFAMSGRARATAAPAFAGRINTTGTALNIRSGASLPSPIVG